MSTYVKTCTKCKVVKSVTNFNQMVSSKDGLSTHCKQCKKEYRQANAEQIKERDRRYQKEYHQLNKDAINKQKSERRASNKDNNEQHIVRLSKRDYDKQYRRINKDRDKQKINERNRQYQNEKYRNDALFALTKRTRSLIWKSLSKKGYSKNSRTHEILGCSFEEFKSHLESQFIDGMSWDNRDKWHIDHIKPISWAKTEDEIIAFSHYTNLKPMWALDNILKSNHYEG